MADAAAGDQEDARDACEPPERRHERLPVGRRRDHQDHLRQGSSAATIPAHALHCLTHCAPSLAAQLAEEAEKNGIEKWNEILQEIKGLGESDSDLLSSDSVLLKHQLLRKAQHPLESRRNSLSLSLSLSLPLSLSLSLVRALLSPHSEPFQAFRENALGERAWKAMLVEIEHRLGREKAAPNSTPPSYGRWRRAAPPAYGRRPGRPPLPPTERPAADEDIRCDLRGALA